MIRLLLLALAGSLTLLACDDTIFGEPAEDAHSTIEPSDTESDRYHPSGWSSPDVHGLAAKLQEETCTTCHGDDLTGVGSALSCDSCHPTGWRTDCTFCHGGTLTDDGAPPTDIDGSVDDISFAPHPAHVTEHIGPGFDCTQCHAKPTDVLSEGHLFVGDDTPGQAELDFTAGLSPAATATSTGCSNLYCHGDGQRDNGTVERDESPMACDSCHPSITSGESGWDRMSGEHDDHLADYGLACADCHGDTTADDATIADTSVHVDGEVQLTLPSTLSMRGLTCNGSCHGGEHDDRDWD